MFSLASKGLAYPNVSPASERLQSHQTQAATAREGPCNTRGTLVTTGHRTLPSLHCGQPLRVWVLA